MIVAFVVGNLVVSSSGLIMVFQIGANYISFKLYSCSRASYSLPLMGMMVVLIYGKAIIVLLGGWTSWRQSYADQETFSLHTKSRKSTFDVRLEHSLLSVLLILFDWTQILTQSEFGQNW